MENDPDDSTGGYGPDDENGGVRGPQHTDDGWCEPLPPASPGLSTQAPPRDPIARATDRILCSLFIVGICCVVYFFSDVVQLIPMQWLVFSPGNGLIFPGILSHMFAHANFMHLLGNMFILFFLGTVVERSYGSGRYLALYFVSGLFAALAEGAMTPDGLLLGASGALAGVMAAFVLHYPKALLYIWGIAPVPAWLFILGWLGFNIWGAGASNLAGGNGMNIAFSAHLGGFFSGLVMSYLLVPPYKRITNVLE
jgi:membrane associated rhomboid family serine protease